VACVPRVFVGFTGGRGVPPATTTAFDVLVDDDEHLAAVVANAARWPLASSALVLLLRGGAGRSVPDGLIAESSTYSTLQAGPEHGRWLAGHERRVRAAECEPAVRVERRGGRLALTLARPHVRNAFDARMRTELLDALAVAASDPEITEVVLEGAGPTFCSGGDLAEFGTLVDPASAHVLRIAQSAGLAIDQLAAKVTVHVHGRCVGAGVELPAFAGRVVAAPETSFLLPELAMGLVPGAGGTVSLPRRIGRQRTALLALLARPVDAETAQAWGLIDAIA